MKFIQISTIISQEHFGKRKFSQDNNVLWLLSYLFAILVTFCHFNWMLRNLFLMNFLLQKYFTYIPVVLYTSTHIQTALASIFRQITPIFLTYLWHWSWPIMLQNLFLMIFLAQKYSTCSPVVLCTSKQISRQVPQAFSDRLIQYFLYFHGIEVVQ